VSVEGESFRLEPPFLVIATQNPIELEGTYPLPEAQLDRFLMRIAWATPARTRSDRSSNGGGSGDRTRPGCGCGVPGRNLAMQHTLEDVFVSDASSGTWSTWSRRLAATTGRLGASPRAPLGVTDLARAWAALRGAISSSPDDVKAMAGSALAHRLISSPSCGCRSCPPPRS